jgi:hypothetical protein
VVFNLSMMMIWLNTCEVNSMEAPLSLNITVSHLLAGSRTSCALNTTKTSLVMGSHPTSVLVRWLIRMQRSVCLQVHIRRRKGGTGCAWPAVESRGHSSDCVGLGYNFSGTIVGLYQDDYASIFRLVRDIDRHGVPRCIGFAALRDYAVTCSIHLLHWWACMTQPVTDNICCRVFSVTQ